jgi:Leucine-rich repeat (LRR) protein
MSSSDEDKSISNELSDAAAPQDDAPDPETAEDQSQEVSSSSSPSESPIKAPEAQETQTEAILESSASSSVDNIAADEEITPPVSKSKGKDKEKENDEAVESKTKAADPPVVAKNTKLSLSWQNHTKWPSSLIPIETETLQMFANKLTSIPKGTLKLCVIMPIYFITKLPDGCVAEVTKLTNLQILAVADNDLTSVTKHLTALTSLTALDIDGNVLTTTSFVPESMRLMTNLVELTLSRNLLTEVPDWLFCLTNLRKLDISLNPEIAEVPEDVSKLISLETLNLNTIGMHDLPKSISKLTNLTMLSVAANYLEDLPKGFRRLTKLKALNISHNEFVDFPPSLLKFERLESFITGGNPKKITIPKSLFAS